MLALDIARDELWQAAEVGGGWEKVSGKLAAWHEMVCQMWYWLRPLSSKAETKNGN
jgi:hypothetical protein